MTRLIDRRAPTRQVAFESRYLNVLLACQSVEARTRWVATKSNSEDAEPWKGRSGPTHSIPVSQRFTGAPFLSSTTFLSKTNLLLNNLRMKPTPAAMSEMPGREFF